MPKEIIDVYKDRIFYQAIINHLKRYAEKHQDRILQKYIEMNKLSPNILEETINNEKYLKSNESTIDISSYVKEYIYKSEEYLNFKKDKACILENLLDNVKSFDSKGNVVKIQLSSEQKDTILQQYKESFDDSVKELIENSPDEFEDLFIANNSMQFEKLFPKTYVETLKEQAINRFKSENVMEAVRYGLAYPEELKSAMSEKYVKNDKYKTLLVFNNTKNILNLTPENIIQEEQNKEEVVKEYEIPKEQESEKSQEQGPLSIFIPITNKEVETYKGIYLPVSEIKQIYIPRELYKKEDEKIKIISSNARNARMSEYEIDEQSKTRRWISRLTLDDFCNKYLKVYGVTREKEVMPDASY